MGLDMYAYTTREAIPLVDFEHPEDSNEIAYWRKHPNLHGWMHRLYDAKGGKSERFNCDQLQLVSADLDTLEQIVLADALPDHTGFFYGVTRPDEKYIDLAFIARARHAIAEGYQVFYSSWW